jgi:hypothetical protein
MIGSKFKLATIVLVYRQTLKLLSVLADTDFAVYCTVACKIGFTLKLFVGILAPLYCKDLSENYP